MAAERKILDKRFCITLICSAWLNTGGFFFFLACLDTWHTFVPYSTIYVSLRYGVWFSKSLKSLWIFPIINFEQCGSSIWSKRKNRGIFFVIFGCTQRVFLSFYLPTSVIFLFSSFLCTPRIKISIFLTANIIPYNHHALIAIWELIEFGFHLCFNFNDAAGQADKVGVLMD